MTAPRIGNAQSALNRIRQNELDNRRQARTILQPSEVAGGLNPARLLTTTLGGAGVRAITPDDLRKFKKTVADLGDKARQGLTAKEALGLSRPADIDRARAEIRYSMPARLQAGKVHLVTDSGPRSKVSRHHVNVEFSMYSAALSRPGTSTQAAQWLCKESPLRFECDCHHFRYFLRFTATAGGWVAGRMEHGFPKITNPTLDGACCKHLARIMTDVQSSIGFRQHFARMIEVDRSRIDKPGKAKPRAFVVSQAEAERILPKNTRRIVVARFARCIAAQAGQRDRHPQGDGRLCHPHRPDLGGDRPRASGAALYPCVAKSSCSRPPACARCSLSTVRAFRRVPPLPPSINPIWRLLPCNPRRTTSNPSPTNKPAFLRPNCFSASPLTEPGWRSYNSNSPSHPVASLSTFIGMSPLTLRAGIHLAVQVEASRTSRH